MAVYAPSKALQAQKVDGDMNFNQALADLMNPDRFAASGAAPDGNLSYSGKGGRSLTGFIGVTLHKYVFPLFSFPSALENKQLKLVITENKQLNKLIMTISGASIDTNPIFGQ